MDKKLIWAIASAGISSNEKLSELARDHSALAVETLDAQSERAKAIIEDFKIAETLGVDVVSFIDGDYPPLLREIASPPPFFYLRGKREALSRALNVGIVGPRKATHYGMNVAMEFAASLASYGIGIISGGAVGVDGAAHRGALSVGGLTVAVLGCGIDVDYPRENVEMLDKIAQTGAVISELPMGSPPYKTVFRHRNRIIAGLSRAVVVTEAGRRSGALITANHADDQGKPFFAVPGNINSHQSAGANALLKDGALFALSHEDILDELLLRFPDFFKNDTMAVCNAPIKPPEEKILKAAESASKAYGGLSAPESEIVSLLTGGEKTIDEIENACQNKDVNLLGLLNMLELKGIIRLGFGKRYKLNDTL